MSSMSSNRRQNRFALCFKKKAPYLLFLKRRPNPATPPEVVVLTINENGRFSVAQNTKTPRTFDEARHLFGPFDSKQEYPAVFGCVQLDKLFLLVATEIQLGGQLPFEREIYTITGTKWLTLPVEGVPPPRISIKDIGRIKAFTETNFHNGYYFSDDAEMQAPFPCTVAQRRLVGEYFQCDFSVSLRRPFKDIPNIEVDSILSTLIRGFASSCVLPCHGGLAPLNVMLLGRQNNTNPGPRYHSRGLNGKDGTGNDHIYELVLWRYTSPKRDRVAFTRHTILRGTIPLNWRSEIKSGIGEADVVFGTKSEILSGSQEYFTKVFRKLQRLHKHDMTDIPPQKQEQGDTAEAKEAAEGDQEEWADNEPPVPEEAASLGLRCINLLRLKNNTGEEALSKYFVEAVRGAEPEIKKANPTNTLDLVHHDWLNSVKDDGMDASVEMLWQYAVPFLTTNGSPSASVGEMGKDGSIQWSGPPQRQFVRINCADSLDRTNVGCFFTCLQMALDMCRVMNINHHDFQEDNAGRLTASPSTQSLTPQDKISSDVLFDTNAVPVGKEGKLREPFVHSVDNVKQKDKYPQPLLRAIAEMFVNNGDCVAMLYTSSGALHTSVIRNFVPGMKGASANAILSVQRRFENVFEDKRKFRNIEALLGRNLPFHFPTLYQSIFGVCPIPSSYWKATIVIKDVPFTTRTAEIQRSLKTLWDELIAARLEREVEGGKATVVVHSSALDIRVFEAYSAVDDNPQSPALLFDRSLAVFAESSPNSNTSKSPSQKHSDPIAVTPPPASLESSDQTTPQTTNLQPIDAASPQTSSSANPSSPQAYDFEDYDDLVITNSRSVVVQFDPDTCKILDIAGEFLKLGSIPIEVPRCSASPSNNSSEDLPSPGQNIALPIERYSYDVATKDDTSKLKPEKIAKTLRGGIRDAIKTIVRKF